MMADTLGQMNDPDLSCDKEGFVPDTKTKIAPKPTSHAGWTCK